jgi:hypothetical protein
VSELSGAETEAQQEGRPGQESEGKPEDAHRRHPGPPVTGDHVGFDEEAAAEADRDCREEKLTDPRDAGK